jgi:Tol biopolymer transport system component
MIRNSDHANGARLMTNHTPAFLTYRRLASIFVGSFLLVFGTVFFFDVSAQTEDAENPANRNVQGSADCQNGNCVRNGKIAYARNGELFTINSDGTNPTNITNNPATDGEPNWSPNGAKIAFSTNRDGNAEIYQMNADGSNPERLTTNTASDFSPYYSPDGLTIVFSSERDGNSEIYKMNADGSNQIRLTNDAGRQTYPAFSPDGQKIVYVSEVQNSATPMLFTMNVDGSNNQPITSNNLPGQSYALPSYSPDGSKIIFSYSVPPFPPFSGTLETYTMNADGTNVQFSNGVLGSYSPDGTKIVYTNKFIQAGQTHFLFTANADRSSPQGFVGDSSPIGAIDWQPVPVAPPAFDFDGDGRSDVSAFRPSDGSWHLLRSQTGYSALQWGLSTDVLAPADYDGDLKTDVAVWRPSEGNFYVLNSFNSTVRIENFGLAGDVPTGGDWDGDGKADLAVYRGGAQGTFYFRSSMGNPQGNISNIPWGISGDKPVTGDYDGDGKTDAAIFRPSNGTWYVRQSSNGQLSAGNFGLADDRLVPADYDADGKTDLAVFRNGIWYLLRSTQGFTAFQFGISTDVPAPADYDGDGKADPAIYRNGVWWIANSQSGSVNVVSFGLASDKPVPTAFVR